MRFTVKLVLLIARASWLSIKPISLYIPRVSTPVLQPLVKSLFSEFPAFTRRIDSLILLKGSKHILDHDTLLKASDYKPNLSHEIIDSRPQSRGSSHTSTI